eukprot:jgi/Galph1/2585/GphlegSOOS_G1244.1
MSTSKTPSKTSLKQAKPLQPIKKNTWNLKKIYKSSFFPRWPLFRENEQEQLVALLEEVFNGALHKRNRRRGGKRKHKARTSQRQKIPFVFGFNQVLRLAERGELEAIFVTKDVEPAILNQHFPWICLYRNILIFPLTQKYMQRLCFLFQLRSLLVMGLKKGWVEVLNENNEGTLLNGQYSFSELENRLKALAPCFDNNDVAVAKVSTCTRIE